ncbi:MAG TPA: sulfurtransferase [Burkholderiales bacterium]|jgi:thiosulfate/3-mercaptopyruvate sulfurtransferase
MSFQTLITPERLVPHINDPAWRIFDCRHELSDPNVGEQAYREAHIPGAQFLHVDRDLSGAKTGANGRHPLPDPAAFAARLGRCGVSNNTQVVAYDDAGGMYAARLWWMLRWLGHDKVAVLDGGLPAWRQAGYGVTRDTPEIEPASFEWRLSDQPVETDYVVSHLHDPDVLLLDARGADRFRGENETIDPVAGHIPGAVSRPFRDNLNADGRFRSPQDLRKAFASLLGKHRIDNVVAYCGSGVSACHNLLALTLAGFDGAKLYPGSWSEWCSDPGRPIATGSDC